VYRRKAKERGRCPIYGFKPGVVTRWKSAYDESARGNTIMDDTSATLSDLLSPTCFDKDMLKDKDGRARNINALIYTPTDKVNLRQYETGFKAVYILNDFYQYVGVIIHEELFEIQYATQATSTESFEMFADVSHRRTRVVNLKTERTGIDLIVGPDFDQDDDANEQYSNVCPVQGEIRLGRKLYRDDLCNRMGLMSDWVSAMKLPNHLAVPTMLVPIYGGKKRMALAGLMTPTQYDAAEMKLLDDLALIIDKDDVACARAPCTGSEGSYSCDEDEDDTDGSDVFMLDAHI
jgi:hypothetical protein